MREQIMISSYLGLYWGARRESLDACVARLTDFVHKLGAVDPAYERWYAKGSSRAASTPMLLDQASLRAALANGVNRRDDTGEPIPELGFSFSGWNRSKPEVGLSMTIGAFAREAAVANFVVLSFYAAEDSPIYSPSKALQALRVAVHAWDPVWATWTTQALQDGQDFELGSPTVGWMTYVDTSVANVENGGWTRSGRAPEILQAAENLVDVTPREIARLRQALGLSADPSTGAM
jgi:hypothetical protein